MTNDFTAVLTRGCEAWTSQLDQLEERLPDIPARAVGLSRATAHRVSSTAESVINDVRRQVGRFSATADTATATTVGQARSAVRRTTAMAVRTTNETTGQARAQAARTASAAEDAASALLGDATRAVEPGGDDRPASLDNWTKAELYERAQELDIDGRSAMGKSQLVRAIRAA